MARSGKVSSSVQQVPGKPSYWLTRFIFLRGMGFVYFFAFLSAALQAIPLYGETGLLPVGNFLSAIDKGSLFQNFVENPTLFWLHRSDNFLLVLAWAGAGLSLLVLIGYANSIIMFCLWIMYMSYVNIGQLFYGFGWEIQTLEIGFLCIFLVPLFDWRPFSKREPPLPVIWLFRWFIFRFYLGAGLIKLRGSECWDDFTCLYYHFETQPIPNPLSPVMHFLPHAIHRGGVMFTEFLQVIAAFMVFYPRILRISAGIIFLIFQSTLILTGNYAFFNWITLVPALMLFDDRFLQRVFPQKLVNIAGSAQHHHKPFSLVQNNLVYMLFGILLWMSVPVVANLISKEQVMNRSFNRWSLVNTYGAFGAVDTVRYELVIAGTSDAVVSDTTVWREYEFLAKPTNIDRALPILAPYQPRIDWQIWFAAKSSSNRQNWLIHLIWKFLHNDQQALCLIKYNPFADSPPIYIKVDRYIYKFAEPSSTHTWERTFVDSWLIPLSKQNQSLRQFIEQNNWENYEN